MAEYMGSEEGRKRSGRQPKMPEFQESFKRLRRDEKKEALPTFDEFLLWLRGSNLSKVSARGVEEVLERREEPALLTSRVGWLPEVDSVRIPFCRNSEPYKQNVSRTVLELEMNKIANIYCT